MNIRTPSGWHDDTSGRDAGHDEMQLHLLQNLSTIMPTLPTDDGERLVAYRLDGVEAEVPTITEGGNIVAFSDVVALYKPTPGHGPHSIRVHFELKPRIYSVGACIRQAHALTVAVTRLPKGEAQKHRRSLRSPDQASNQVCLAVYDDDPKLGMLRTMCVFPILPIKRPPAP